MFNQLLNEYFTTTSLFCVTWFLTNTAFNGNSLVTIFSSFGRTAAVWLFVALHIHIISWMFLIPVSQIMLINTIMIFAFGPIAKDYVNMLVLEAIYKISSTIYSLFIGRTSISNNTSYKK